MCLSIAVHRPNAVLATGSHAGHEWVVVHNGMGYRCGYVKVNPGHPWHGKGYDDIEADVHGGLTFSDPDEACGKDGPDNGWWVGFDCAHCGDAPDPSLPGYLAEFPCFPGYHVRTEGYVKAQCRRLCEQAKASGGAA